MKSLSEFIKRRYEICEHNTVADAEYSCTPEAWFVEDRLSSSRLKVNGYILNIMDLHNYDVFLEDNYLQASDDTYKIWEQLVVGHYMYLPAICGSPSDPWRVRVGIKPTMIHERLKDATDYVYDKCDGIFWHVITKDMLPKVKKYGLVPKNIDTDELQRPFRRFFIASPDKSAVKKDIEYLQQSLADGINDRMEDTGKKYRVSYEDQIVLRIDLKKRREKMKFYHDNSAWHLNAVFTEYVIPPYLVKEWQS